MYTRRILALCLLAAFIVIAISGCGKEETKIYKIGAIFDTTGVASALGIPEKNTAEMRAVARTNVGNYYR